MEDEEIVQELITQFPDARRGVLEVFVKAMRVHSDKNHDYNGDAELYRATGVKGRFSDIWRKVIRLFNLVWEPREPKVNESVIDTAEDLVVYSAMLVEELKNEVHNS